MDMYKVAVILCSVVIMTAETNALWNWLRRRMGKLDHTRNSRVKSRAADTSNNVCISKECQRTVYMLQSSMDMSVKPCHNFYKFACGKFPATFPLKPWQGVRSWTDDLDEQLAVKVRDYLGGSVSVWDPMIVNGLRMMYGRCLNMERQDKSKYDAFRQALSVAKLPTLPIFNKDVSVDWVLMAAKLATKGIHEFMFRVFVYGSMNNRHLNTVYIGKDSNEPVVGDLAYLSYKCDDQIENEPPSVEAEIIVNTRNKPAFKKFVFGAMRLLRDHFKMANVDFDNNSQLHEDIDRLFDFLYKRDAVKNAVYLDSKDEKMLTLGQLQQETDKLLSADENGMMWIRYLDTVFDKHLKLTYYFDEDVEIGTISWDYIRKALSLLGKTDGRIIALAIWYDCLEKYASVSTIELRNLYYTFKREIGLPDPESWSMQCAKVIAEKFSLAVSFMFTRETNALEKINKVEIMTRSIIRVFKEKSITESKWMSEESKNVALQKIEFLKYFIGFPTWLKHASKVNSAYSDAPSAWGAFVKFISKFDLFQTKSNLENLLELNMSNKFGYYMNPVDANASFSPNNNNIAVPYATLHQPFYDNGIAALDFGAIGAIIGHEITHGFDNMGKEYDLYGRKLPWMSEETTKNFQERSKCFVKLYDGFHVNEVSQNVDGELTLNENIADNGGVTVAYEAYRRYKPENTEILPGYEDYTSDQLFTLGFAMTYCSHSSKTRFNRLMKNEHAPPEQRVNGAMMNFEEFSKIWGCPSDALMNPTPKCKIW